ncbi:MAG: hypothetical protein QNJ00_14165 [Woeseiaceae bacterium]|nr:hypothetical protein [Woeseiaceae bacterium]
MNAYADKGLTLEAFERGDIDAAEFDHGAHVYAAWLFLDSDPVSGAERFVGALKRLTRKLGVPGKYHDTITRFYLAVINERMHGTGDTGWAAFERSNPDLFAAEDNVLFRYYSRERLGSDAARQTFLLPDRVAAA